MTITLIVLSSIIALYFGACILQWRRLSKADREAHENPYPPAP